MSVISIQYNNSFDVSFTQDAWFNATAVAKQFKKRTENYLRTDSTKEYMVELHNELFPENPVTLKSVTEENQLVRIVQGGKPEEQGSWFHPELAVDFARWLSPRFAIWCDRQIKKILKNEPVQQDFVNEPLKIAFATKEQREPLVKAVRGLVMTAKSKGRNISFEEAHQMVNFSIGVTSVEEMTVEMIPEAIKSVGVILRTIVLEGEFIAKGEAETKLESQPEEITYIPPKEMQKISELIVRISKTFGRSGALLAVTHDCIRKETGTKSPEKYQEKHRAQIAKVVAHIIETADKVRSIQTQFELDVCQKLLRNGAKLEDIVSEIELQQQNLLSELEKDFSGVLPSLNRLDKELLERTFAA